MGIHALNFVIEHPELELIAADADCVLFMPRDVTQLDPTVPGSPGRQWVDAVLPILESGKNVISPVASGMRWRQLAEGAALKKELDAACEKGSSSIYFTGIDRDSSPMPSRSRCPPCDSMADAFGVTVDEGSASTSTTSSPRRPSP